MRGDVLFTEVLIVTFLKMEIKQLEDDGKVIFRITNKSNHEEVFKMECEPEDGAEFMPPNGILSPGETIHVISRQKINEKVSVYVDHHDPLEARNNSLYTKLGKVSLIFGLIFSYFIYKFINKK